MLSLETTLSISFLLQGVRLLGSREMLNAFGNRVGVGEAQIATVAPGGIQIVELGKDRIELELVDSPEGMYTTVSMGYPERSQLGRLAEVIQCAVDASALDDEVELEAVGYRIDTVCTTEGEPASKYIARCLIAERFLRVEERPWQLVGGAVKLTFNEEEGVRNLMVEPRLSDPSTQRMFIGMILTVPASSIPSRDEIKTTLEGVWDDVAHFTSKIADN